jgi:hypothetical protein
MQIGERQVRLREQFERIVAVISAVRNVGDGLAALDPVHAGLPWAGVSLLLSVSVCYLATITLLTFSLL